MSQVTFSHSCNRLCRRHGCSYARLSLKALAVASAPPEIIVLLYLGQADSDRNLRYTSIEHARLLKLLHAGKFENHGKSFRENRRAPAPELPRFACSKSAESSPEISFAEMNANVGITENQTEPDEPPLRHLVQRAREKVRSIGRGDYTRDVKAVTISGYRVIGASSSPSSQFSVLSSQNRVV